MYQPPPMPPPRRNALIANFLSLPLVVRILLGVVLVICIIGTAIGAITSGGSPKTATATATSAPIVQATQPRTTATTAPKPTATVTPSGPQLLNTATLGGTEAAFQTKYGNPTGTGTAKTYTFTQPGVIGLVTATPNGDKSSDGQNHIASLRIGPQSGSWDEPTATPICAQFLPSDAKFVSEQQVSGYGPERVYTSAALAQVFSSGDFNGATPGTFAMELGPDFPTNEGCIIILGT